MNQSTIPLKRILFALLLLAGQLAAKADAAEPLADAAQRGDWSRVRSLLSSKVDCNSAQPDGTTALHWAAWRDNVTIARLLLKNGARVDSKNRYGVSALSLACENGNPDLVSALLSGGADPNNTRAGGETVLMLAARTGKLGPVKALIRHGAKVRTQDRKQQTAIMWAAAEGHASVVKHLIQAGAEFRRSLKSGFNPWFFAVRENRPDVVAELLKAGVDVNCTMQPKRTGGRAPRAGTSALLLAVENGHFDLAVQLLKAGADPRDERSGFTALHALTWVRKPNLGDGLDGAPAPIVSGRVSGLDLARELVKKGAKVNARLRRGRSGRGRLNFTGATPFLMAADTADLPFMRLLLKLGADPTIPNADGCPPLLAAAGIGTLAPGEEAGTQQEALEAVRLLLDLGADVNAVDKNGETAMHGAAYKSLPQMVRFLAANGADIKVWNRKNKYGWTPVLIAEGHRPGNFKPAAATLEQIHRVMIAAGVRPPPLTPRSRVNSQYRKRRSKRPADKKAKQKRKRN